MPDTHPAMFSYGDALFLYLERECAPLNVAAVCELEGAIPLGACRRFVESKLPLIPRYWQRAVMPPFNLGLPSWENDPDFDIANHVREITLPHGSDAEFKAAASRILSSTLDRSRPLWDLTLVRGLKRNRTGLVARVHHCLADGVSGVGILNALMDPNPVSAAPSARRPHFSPPAPRDPLTELVEAFLDSCFGTVERVLSLQSDMLTLAQRMLAMAGDVSANRNGESGKPQGFNSPASIPTLEEFSRFMPELLAPIERLPFNTVCQGPQNFTWTEAPLPAIKAIKQACGATVNDVVLALLTSAFRRYAELHGTRIQGKLLRIVVPVNVRTREESAGLGNRITFLPLAVPLDIKAPRKLILAIRERMGFLKNMHVAESVSLAGSVLGIIPAPVQAMLGPIAGGLPLSVCNTICTNVPGPQVPLYLIGHKMLNCYPYVPIGSEMGINCAVLTYNGVAHFGFIADSHAAPDVERLRGFLDDSFAEMQQAFKIEAPPRPSQARPAAAPSRAARRVRRRPAATVAPKPPGEPQVAATPEPIAFPTQPAAQDAAPEEVPVTVAVGA